MKRMHVTTKTILILLTLASLALLSGCGAKTMLVVDPTGNGDYTKIQAAIRDWQEGQKLVIKPGIYDEQIRLRTHIQLDGLSGVAPGETPQPVVIAYSGEGPAVTGRDVSNVKMRNIVIQKKNPTKHSAVVLQSTDIEIENCRISGGPVAGIEALEFGYLVLKNTHVENNGYAGLFFHHQARAQVEKSKISGNQRGVVVNRFPNGVPPTLTRYRDEDGPDITIDASTIETNTIGGLYLQKGAEVRAINSRFVANGMEEQKTEDGKMRINYEQAAIVADPRSTLITADNEFSFNHIGVTLKEGCEAEITKSSFTTNTAYGMVVIGNAKHQILENKFKENGSGMILKDGSDALVRDNQFLQNTHQGIEIGEVSRPVIERNWLIQNAEAGVYVFDNAKPEIKYNIFVKNGWYGLLVAKDSKPNVFNNTFYYNEKVAAWFTKRSEGLFAYNVIVGSPIGISLKKNNEMEPKTQANLFWENTTDWIGYIDTPTFTITKDPMFTNPDAYDFTPLPESPLVKAGGGQGFIGAVDRDEDGV